MIIGSYKDLPAIAKGTILTKGALFALGDVNNKDGQQLVWPSDKLLKNINLTYEMPKLDLADKSATGSITLSENNEKSKIVSFTVYRKETDQSKINAVAKEFENIEIHFRNSIFEKVDALTNWTIFNQTELNKIGNVTQNGKDFVWPSDLKGATLSYRHDAYQPNMAVGDYAKGQIKVDYGSASKIVDFQFGNTQDYRSSFQVPKKDGNQVEGNATFEFILNEHEERQLLSFNGDPVAGNPVNAFALYNYLLGGFASPSGAATHAPFSDKLVNDIASSNQSLYMLFFFKKVIYDQITDWTFGDLLQKNADSHLSSKLFINFSWYGYVNRFGEWVSYDFSHKTVKLI